MSVFKIRKRGIFVDRPFKGGILDNTAIKDVYIRRSGINLYTLCPFHLERSASMCINVSKDIWHCFGCGSSHRYSPNPSIQRNFNDLRKVIALRYRMDQNAKEYNREFAKEIEYTNNYINNHQYLLEHNLLPNDCPF